MSESSFESVIAPWQREALARGRQKGAVLVTPAPLSLQEPTQQIVFTHLPKTGGLTLRSVLAGLCWAKKWAWEECLGGPTPEPGDALHNYRARCPQRLAAARLIWGHLPFGLHDAPASSIVLLRDPVERELSFYAMGVSRGAYPMGTPLSALREQGVLPDNIQCRMLAGDSALLQPGSVCTPAAFERARENLLTRYALAGDVARFNDFVAVLLAALRAPSMLFFHRNMRAVDLPPAVTEDITRDTKSRAAYDIALFEAIKGKVRVALTPAEEVIAPTSGWLAFKDELPTKFIHHAGGNAETTARLASQGTHVSAHTFDASAVEFC